MMTSWVGSEEESGWKIRRHDYGTGVHMNSQSTAGMRASLSFFEPCSSLGDIVESIWDWDIPDGDAARALEIKVLPSTMPIVVVQYRTPIASVRNFGGIVDPHRRYSHLATQVETGVVTIRPDEPIGAVCVRLRPQAAGCLLGEHIQEFADTKVELGDIFGARNVLLLAEMIAEASSGAERCACMLRFLRANMSRREPDPVASRAASRLHGDPAQRIGELAADLDVSERHLSRRFRTMFGVSPKQFARLARIEKVVAAREAGSAWADAAYACGFSDQAHLINDFNAIVGAPPERALCRSSAGADRQKVVMIGGISHSRLPAVTPIAEI